MIELAVWLQLQLCRRKTKLGTDFDGPSWIQYDLFRNNKLPESKKVNLAKFMLRATVPVSVL